MGVKPISELKSWNRALSYSRSRFAEEQ